MYDVIKFCFSKVIKLLAIFLYDLIKLCNLLNKILMGFGRTSPNVKIFPCGDSLVIVRVIKGKTTQDGISRGQIFLTIQTVIPFD